MSSSDTGVTRTDGQYTGVTLGTFLFLALPSFPSAFFGIEQYVLKLKMFISDIYSRHPRLGK